MARKKKKARKQGSDDDEEEPTITLQEFYQCVPLQHINTLILPSDLKRVVRDLLAKAREVGYNWVTTKYYQRDGARLYAKGGSLQTVKGWVCRMITKDLYWDVDMVNAAPVCLLHVFKEALGHAPPTLEWYVESRDHAFEVLKDKYKCLSDAPLKTLKRAWLSSMHGGSYTSSLTCSGVVVDEDITELVDFEREIAQEASQLKTHPEYAALWFNIHSDPTKHNKVGSFLSIAWQRLEAKILLKMVEFFQESKFVVSVLKHDGLYIYRNGVTGDFTPAHLRGCETFIKTDLGVAISLCEKPRTILPSDVDLFYGDVNYALIDREFDRITYAVMRYGKMNGMVRYGGHAMTKHPKIPGVYEKALSAADIINKVSTDLFMVCTSIDKKIAWFEQCDHPAFPLYNTDSFNQKVISYENGYLDLEKCDFVKWEDASDIPLTRHYYNTVIDLKFNVPTPLWTNLLETQLLRTDDPEWPEDILVDVLEMLIGRLFYGIGEYDNWQGCPIILGDANTGKSTVCDVVAKMFPPSDVGIITASLEERFGLMGLYDKRLVIAPDMPPNISKILNPADFQSMAAGDMMSVAVKYKDPVMRKWKPNLFLVGNKGPNWKDARGSIKRRLFIFMFETLVRERKTNLLEEIVAQELPYIMFRCISKYRQYVETLGTADFWKSLPSYMHETSTDVNTTTNPLSNFLANGSPYYQITFEKGSTTELTELKRAFMNYMKFDCGKRGYSFPTDMHPIREAGYTIETVNICKVCLRRANKANCGDHYTRQNRRKRKCILNMKIINKKNRHQDEPFFVG